MKHNSQPYMALSSIQFQEKNLGRSFSKLVESIYIPYKGRMIENTGTGYKVGVRTFQDISKAKDYIDNENGFNGKQIIPIVYEKD